MDRQTNETGIDEARMQETNDNKLRLKNRITADLMKKFYKKEDLTKEEMNGWIEKYSQTVADNYETVIDGMDIHLGEGDDTISKDLYKYFLEMIEQKIYSLESGKKVA